MTTYTCADECGWEYDTSVDDPDKMPPQPIQRLPDGAAPLRSNLVTTLYCPACMARHVYDFMIAAAPVVTES